jgi:hypothetical protein
LDFSQNPLLAKSFQGFPRIGRHFAFHDSPALDVEFQDSPLILEHMHVGRIVIGQVPDNDDTKTLPSAHVYLYPKVITLVNTWKPATFARFSKINNEELEIFSFSIRY